MAGIGRRRGDDELILALAAGKSVAEAAKQAGISERTAHRRWADPQFQTRVSEVRFEITERAVASLSSAALDAATTLRNLLSAPSDAVRLRAATAILDLGPKLRDATELENGRHGLTGPDRGSVEVHHSLTIETVVKALGQIFTDEQILDMGEPKLEEFCFALLGGDEEAVEADRRKASSAQ